MTDQLKVVEFISSLGIKCEQVRCLKNTFLPHVAIQNGGILYTEKAPVSDLLHESGHLALMPIEYRKIASGGLLEAFKKMFGDFEKFELDSLMSRYLMQCSDQEVTAWAYAAGKHLGIDDKKIIHKNSYNKTGKDILFALSNSCYVGINGLQHSEFTTTRTYPAMKKWLATL